MLSIISLISLTVTFCGCFYLLYIKIVTLQEWFKSFTETQSKRTDLLFEMFNEIIKKKDKEND